MTDQPALSPSTPKTCRRDRFWLGLSLAVAAFLGFQSLQYAFSSAYIVQDDARQHVFWMQRFLDPALFPNDLIADYFQSVAPVGHTTLYRLMAGIGIEPLVLNKVLPLLLGLITTGYCFGVSLQLLPIPAGAFLTTLLLNQSLWLEDDLVSATPRAFLYPLFLAFLYYLLRRSLFGVGVAITLEGVFYPPAALLSLAILTLRLVRWQSKFPRLSQQRTDYWLWGTGLIVAVLVLLPYELIPNPFGPVVTVAQAKEQLEFLQVEGVQGRAFFFAENPLIYWLFGLRTGLLFWLLPPLVWAGFALPFWLRQPARLPLLRQVREVHILTRIVLASLALFLLAHIFLFHLHFPSRYTYHSLRVVAALAAGIALTVWLEAKSRLVKQQSIQALTGRQFLCLGLTLVCGLGLAIAPFFPQLTLPSQIQIVGKAPQLYEYLLEQPKDTLTASVAEEVNNLPSFAARSILVGREYALPYHTKYYAQIRQRTIDLINAQYSPDLAQVQKFIQKYGVNFLLLDRDAFAPAYLAEHNWISQFQPTTSKVRWQLSQGKVPALSRLVGQCSALETEELILLSAKCINAH